MRALFGIHHIPLHQAQEHKQFFFDIGAPVYKRVVTGFDLPDLSWVPPGARFVLRHHPISENFGRRGETDALLPPSAFGVRSLDQLGRASRLATWPVGDMKPPRRPVVLEAEALAQPQPKALMTPERIAQARQCGREHADLYSGITVQIARAGFPIERLWCSALNEPQLWSTEPPELINAYSLGFLERAHMHGFGAVIFCFGVGWPGNGGVTDAPPIWAPFAEAVAAMRPRDWIETHEYWGLAGPGEGWKWLAGRYTQCPYQKPIFIGESGIDRGVEGVSGHGWTDLPGPMEQRASTYMDQLAWYEERLRLDSRIVAHTPFTCDGDAEDWASFEVLEPHLMAEIRDHAAWVAAQPDVTPPPVPPPTPPPVPPPPTPPPSIAEPDVYDLDGQRRNLAWLYEQYGCSVVRAEAALPNMTPEVFRIVAIFANYGSTFKAEVRNLANQPQVGQPVAFGWPDPDDPEDMLPDLESSGAPVLWSTRGVYNKTPASGLLGFECGQPGAWYYSWVISPSTASDLIDGIGYRASDNTGPLHVVWALQKAAPQPPPPTDEPTDEQLRHAAWGLVYPEGIAYNPDAAFSKFARANALGAPVTNEFDMQNVRAQGFAGGILRARIGDWANIHLVDW